MSRTAQSRLRCAAAAVLVLALPLGSPRAQPLQEDVHTAEEQYRIAEGLYSRRFYDLAETSLRDFLERFPDDELAPHAMFRLIQCLRNLGDDPGTLSAINQFQAKWGDHELAPKLFLWKGELLMKQDRIPVAASCFKRLILNEESVVQEAALYFLAQCYARESKPELALQTYAKIAGNPFDDTHLYRPYALFALAAGHQLKGEFEQASAAFKRLTESDHVPDELREESLYRLAENHFLARRFKQAIERYEALLVDFPDGVFAREARKRRAWSHFALGEFDTAVELCRDWRKVHGDTFDYELDYVHAASLVGVQFFDEALTILKRLLEDDRVPPEYVRLCRFQELVCLANLERHQECIARAREFLDTYPKAAEKATVLYLNAEAAYQLERFGDAADAFASALQSYVGEWDYREPASIRLTECYEKLERFEEAAVVYRRMAGDEAFEDRATFLFKAGECERRAGDLRQSINDFERLLREFPEAREETRVAMLHLGELYAELQEYDQAEARLRALLERPDVEEKARLLFFLGYLAYQQDAYEDAVRELRAALTAKGNGPISANARFYLAGSLLELEQTDEALELFGQLLTLADAERPSFSDALLLRLDRLYYARNQYKVSEAICRMLLKSDNADVVYEASLRLVRILAAQNRLEDAERFLDALLKRMTAPADVPGEGPREGVRAEIMSLMAEVYFLQGKYDQAVGAAENCLAKPGVGVEFSSRARWVLAEILRREGRLSQALHYAVACFIAAADPVYTPRAMFLTIDIFLEQGKAADAWTTWLELQQRYPAFAEQKRDAELVKRLEERVRAAGAGDDNE